MVSRKSAMITGRLSFRNLVNNFFNFGDILSNFSQSSDPALRTVIPSSGCRDRISSGRAKRIMRLSLTYNSRDSFCRGIDRQRCNEDSLLCVNSPVGVSIIPDDLESTCIAVKRNIFFGRSGTTMLPLERPVYPSIPPSEDRVYADCCAQN